MQRKALQDQVVIDKKMEIHQQDYEQRRQKLLERGVRRGSIYRKERIKEVQETHIGPELAIVIKGDVYVQTLKCLIVDMALYIYI